MIRNIATLAAGLALVDGVFSTDAMARRGRSGTGIEDNLPRHSGADDVVGGVRVRGDGTVDDNSTSSSGTTGTVVTTSPSVRGNGTIDDNNNNRRRRGR